MSICWTPIIWSTTGSPPSTITVMWKPSRCSTPCLRRSPARAPTTLPPIWASIWRATPSWMTPSAARPAVTRSSAVITPPSATCAGTGAPRPPWKRSRCSCVSCPSAWLTAPAWLPPWPGPRRPRPLPWPSSCPTAASSPAAPPSCWAPLPRPCSTPSRACATCPGRPCSSPAASSSPSRN